MSEAMNTDNVTRKRGGTSPLKSIGIYAAIALGIFLLGLVPMWLTARERANERDVARSQLRLSRIQNRLASASLDARRGEYELARRAASDFFTELRAEVDRTQNRALTAEQMSHAQEVLSVRDDVITLLARNDPASADRLLDTYVAYRNMLEGKLSTQTAAPQP
jgi:hypothetical protein